MVMDHHHHTQQASSLELGSSELQPTASGSSSASNTNNANATAGPIVCNGCKLGLEETSDSVVVSFGDGLWHVDWSVGACQTVTRDRACDLGRTVQWVIR